MTNRPLRLGTRGSALARWQADWVSATLRDHGVRVETVLITTGGDADQRPIGAIGGEGLFTKEIQRALLDARIDFAVHSLKDLPTETIDGLTLAAIPARESAFDVLVTRNQLALDDLPAAARVGTGSQRRRAQLLFRRADLRVDGIRGNVDTRLKKLADGEYDAIVLAEAGLRRLGLEDQITAVFPPEIMLPAIGQGALGIECRSVDQSVYQQIDCLNDSCTSYCVRAERALLARLHGGCSAPIGAWGRVTGEQLELDAAVLSCDGAQRLTARSQGRPDAYEQVAADVAQSLLDQGAAALIAAART